MQNRHRVLPASLFSKSSQVLESHKKAISFSQNHFLPLKWCVAGCMRGWQPRDTTWTRAREWTDGQKVLFQAPRAQGTPCPPGQRNSTDHGSKELPLQSSLWDTTAPLGAAPTAHCRGLSWADPLEKPPRGPSEGPPRAAMLINSFTATGHSSCFPLSTVGK